jgi:poly(3-hydroxybutyrate) depolymerase
LKIWPVLYLFLWVLVHASWLGIAIACTVKEGREKERGFMATARNQYNTGRLTARPQNNQPKADVTTGLQPLKLDGKRDGFIYVPINYRPEQAAALAVMLHGAGGQAEHG